MLFLLITLKTVLISSRSLFMVVGIAGVISHDVKSFWALEIILEPTDRMILKLTFILPESITRLSTESALKDGNLSIGPICRLNNPRSLGVQNLEVLHF